MLPQPTDNFGTKHAVAQSESRAATPFIPDVNGLVPYKAALEYANGGLYLLPVDPRDPKNPGSRVGKNWPEKSTLDADLIGAYWDCDTPPSIAVHTGRSGLVAFDYDVDGPLPDELAWLKAARCQLSRPGETANERGMYVFAATETFIAGKFQLGDGTQVGEIRSGNSVFIVQPSVHAKASIGAAYQWTGHGSVPELPDIARNYLSKLSTRAVGGKGQIVADREAITAFKSATAQANSRPRALNNLTASLSKKTEGTRDCLRNYLRIAANEARADFYPFDRATAELETAARASYALRAQRGEIGANFETHIGAHDFARLVANAVGHALSRSEAEIVAEANRKYGTHHRDNAEKVAGLQLNTESSAPILTVLGPTDWAQPVPDTEFLIAKVLCADTFGVNAGPKKSLKTHDNQAIAFAVATGQNLYGSALFPVRKPGQVLYIVGEGGQVPVRRTLHRMARAYGLDPAEIARDESFPLVPAFGAAPIDSPAFRDELRSLLDTYQPDLVLIESFYNFHPTELEAGNLFARGQVIDGYHKFVRNECQGATSILTDHYRSTAGKSLDLDNISMAGQAENADSWILRTHRKDGDVAEGNFYLQTAFGSRQWGGTEWHIDWQLGRFDHDAGAHVGEITWDIHQGKAEASELKGETPKQAFETEREYMQYIREYVGRHPGKSKEDLQGGLGARLKPSRAEIRRLWALAVDRGIIEDKSIQREEWDEKRQRNFKRTRKVWVPGKGAKTLADQRERWGGA